MAKQTNLGNMLRLLRLRLHSIAEQRKGFFYRPTDGPKAKENSASWPGDNNRLLVRMRLVLDHVHKSDARVAGLRKDLGDFKGVVHKSIGELARTLERDCGTIRTETTTDIKDFKGDVHKSIRELARTMERDSWEIRTEIREKIDSLKANGNSNVGELEINGKMEGLKSDLKRTKWKVRLLFGTVIFCLVKDYKFPWLDTVPEVIEVIPDKSPSPRKWFWATWE
ncbi:hypothetical protein EV426DRAFT_621210 [Tirmania nivea]|nr:hypothetical protein EV426DRAFT_621210 [Tirmania nivea]